jgi:23S rRNA pseudouridine1911/1915/1917 synthase
MVVNALLYHCGDLSGIGGVTRPGIVHRLDKGTSGVMIAAKNDASHLSLSAQFSSRSMGKKYLALIPGVPDWKEHDVDAPIGRHPHHRVRMAVSAAGKPAKTAFRILAHSDEGSLVSAMPSSGRTHQIRVHLDYRGFPILGDPLYGGTAHRKLSSGLRHALKGMDGFCLHAETLVFRHPVSGETMKIHASIPDDFRLVMHILQIDYPED